MNSTYYLILGFLIILSAFFSASETAFSSVKIIRLRKYVDDGRKGAKRALYIAENFDKTISTLLVGNNIVNIASATIATIIFTRLIGEEFGALISSVVMTITILVFGEILPKSYAKHHAEQVAIDFSNIIYYLIILLKPLTIPFILLNKAVRNFYVKEHAPSVTEDELITIIDTIESEGVLEMEESNLIRSAIGFDDITVEEIRTPRTQIVAIDVKSKLEDIVNVFLTEKYSRIPVYEDSIDQIIGVLYERDLFGKIVQGKKKISIKRLMRAPLFVSKSMKVASLLEFLQKNQAHLAVVLDEYGGTSGIVTLEDAIEELVGDIWDEHDEVPDVAQVIDDHTFIVYANHNLEDFFEEYLPNVEIPDCDYPTIGGWIYDRVEVIASLNDTFTIDQYFKITILEIDNHRMEKVKIEYVHEKTT